MELPVALIGTAIDRGTILHSDIFEHIDHAKFFVVIGVTEQYIAGFFYINSRINKVIESKQDQLDLQYLIRPADYSFLHHDSFISAVDINRINKTDLIETIKDGKTKIVAQLKDEHLQDILCMVRSSKLYSKRTKREFFYE